MTAEHQGQGRFVIGPLGTALTLADLPSHRPVKWTPVRKAEVVAAVRGGLLSRDDAISRYTLTLVELLSWERAVERYGLSGLRATKVQRYREMEKRQRSVVG
jgi:hypothetical protein